MNEQDCSRMTRIIYNCQYAERCFEGGIEFIFLKYTDI